MSFLFFSLIPISDSFDDFSSKALDEVVIIANNGFSDEEVLLAETAVMEAFNNETMATSQRVTYVQRVFRDEFPELRWSAAIYAAATVSADKSLIMGVGHNCGYMLLFGVNRPL